MDIEFEALTARPGAHTRADLIARFGSAQFERAVRAEQIVPLARGIYAGPTHADSMWTCAHALILACPVQAAITGRAALSIWGCVLQPPDNALVVTSSPTRVRRNISGAKLLRTVHEFSTTHVHDLPVTFPEVALVHAVGEVGTGKARALALEAMSSQQINLELVMHMVATRRFRGRRVLREALVAFDVGMHSILEYEGATTVLTGAEFAHLRRQHSMTVQGRHMHIDAYDDELRIAFEFDGVTFHANPARWQSDRERDTLLASVGVQTVRFTTSDVRNRPKWCRDRALEISAQRRRSAYK